MILLAVVAILWAPCVAAWLMLRAQPQPMRAGRQRTEPSGAELRAPEDSPAWSALDDRQLTRLLTESAPRTSTE